MKKNIGSNFIIFVFLIFAIGIFGFCFWNFGKIIISGTNFQSQNLYKILHSSKNFVFKSGGFQELGTIVWLYIFTLITILPLSLLFSLFFYFFLKKEENKTQTIKILQFFFSKSIQFFSSLKEFSWSIIFFSFFFVTFKIQKDSIFFMAILLFFSLFFFITKEILKIFETKDEKLMIIYNASPNLLETILFKLLPQISTELSMLILKIFNLISSLSLIFLITNHSFFFKNKFLISKIPSSFSDDGETILSGIYLFLINFKNSNLFDQQKISLEIIIFSLFLLAINLIIFYSQKILAKKMK